MKSPLFLPALLLAALPLRAEVQLAKPFTPHMVLQREMPAPVWGTAAPGEQIVVKFRDQTKTATAGPDGKWSVKLDALKAGGPDVLTIGDRKLDDVLVGEVWFGSGQSNMDLPVSEFVKNDPVLEKQAAMAHPTLRLLRRESENVWEEATPEHNAAFSALLFSFGVALQEKLHVPVGLMVAALSGNSSAYWLSEDMYRSDAACAEAARNFAPNYNYEELFAKYQVAKAIYEKDHADWQRHSMLAQKAGEKAPSEPRPPRTIGKVGEVNSGKLGTSFEHWARPVVGYGIKGVLWDQGESGTNIVGVDTYTLMGALIRGWRRDWGQGDFPFLYVQKPSGGGPAWDYDDPVTARADKFIPQPKDVPPLPPTGPFEYWYELHLRLMNYPHTYMVTGTDLGSGIHPANKFGYGARAVRVALAAAYGQPHEIYGPLFAAQEDAGDRITIKFTHIGQGLAFKHGDRLQGFEIAGDDQKFVWAEAEIKGDTVVVSSKAVPKPIAVRYAWSSTFPWANLFNRDGLPAQPFRTDNW
jgi:sialate O-acetylesterase